jgi:starch synthase
VGDITHAIYRALHLYAQEEKMAGIRKQVMGLDFSWDSSAQQYIDLYESL